MKHDARTQAAIKAGHPEWVELPATAKEARELLDAGWPEGMPKRFFHGRPCNRGHISPRYASGGLCIACDVPYNREYAKLPRTRERSNAWARRNYRENPQSDEAKAAFREYMRAYNQRPDVKETHRRRMRAVVAEREARKINATPAWLTDEHRAQIESFYDEARRLTELTGIEHQVDHIVPLKAVDPVTRERNACGLHVPWNLQVLTREANIAKLNRFDGGWGCALPVSL